MYVTRTFALPSGTTIEIEVREPPERGLRDVARAEAHVLSLATVIDPLVEVAQVLFDRLGTSVKNADFTIEIGAVLNAKAALVLVETQAAATLKLTLISKRQPSGG